MPATVLRFASKEDLHAYAAAVARGDSVPEFAPVQGGEVEPWVQAFADAVSDRYPSIRTYGTYPGHDPSIDLALDIFPIDKAQGDDLATWAAEDDVIDRFSVDYSIWWQR